MKKQILCILFSFLVAFMVSGCYNKSYEKNYDNNEFISKELDGFCFDKSISNLLERGVEEEFERLGGIKTILEANVDQSTEVTLHISAKADRGRIKFVLIKPDLSVELLKEVSDKDKGCEEDITITCDPGDNKIRIFGKDYSGKYKIIQPNNVVFSQVKALGEEELLNKILDVNLDSDA